jgi:hypothetical protein
MTRGGEQGPRFRTASALIDRYFIRVTDCAGTTLLVLEATPGASDPVTITDGNLQLHASSCSLPQRDRHAIHAPSTA